MSESSTPEQTPRSPCAVCPLEPTLDQVHDGFALASYLRVGGTPCQVLRFDGGALKTEMARQLLEAAEQVVFYAAGAHNLEQLQRVAGLVGEERVACLFGRALSDPNLRARVNFPPAHYVIVGEPLVPARDLARQVQRRPGGRADLRVAGTYRPDDPFVPLAPLSDINMVPPGDYGGFEALAGRAIPLQTSRGYPFPLVFSGQRQWELPLRSQRPERIVADIERYAADFGARHFIFTDMVANARGGTSRRWRAACWSWGWTSSGTPGSGRTPRWIARRCTCWRAAAVALWR